MMNFKERLKIMSLVLFIAKAAYCLSSNGLMDRPSDSGVIIHCSSNLDCPTWFTCDSEKNCQCGDGHNYAMVCDATNQISAVLDCHCVTYDGETNSTYLGACFYNCENTNKKRKDKIYTKLPAQPDMLINKSVCTYFHRTGILCGDCEDGHSPFVLSYNLSCDKCPDGHRNWWKFILVAIVPLTFFYFFVVLFNINVTSSRLHGVVWFSQTMSTPALVRLIMVSFRYGNQRSLIAAKIFILSYSFWNLDLFRSVIPAICLNVTTIQAFALDYLLALYPFMLILLSYFIIELYDRKFACIMRVWKPFHKVLTIFRKTWDIRTSVIDSFSTFFLLSYVKIIGVTTDLLVPTQVYELGSNTTTFRLYYSPTVVYFGSDHWPYALMALVLFTSFVGIPIFILILYPSQFFQRFLSLFPLNWHFLHAFVDSFQGCYKDGTEPGTFDCRWFSTLLLLIRPVFFLLFGLTLSVMFFVYSTIILVLLSIAIINIQPYKKVATRYPSTDIIFFLLLSISYVSLLGRNTAKTENHSFTTIITIIAYSSAFVPIVYIIFLVSFWLISRTSLIRSLVQQH